MIARDRGGGYGEAASRSLPSAIQVADRWHLMENASAAFLDAVRKSMRLIRNTIGAATIDRELLTCAERLQHDGYLRREEANAAIMALAKDGVPIKQIVRQTGHSRKTVRHVIQGGGADVFRTRLNSLEPHLGRVAAGFRRRLGRTGEIALAQVFIQQLVPQLVPRSRLCCLRVRSQGRRS